MPLEWFHAASQKPTTSILSKSLSLKYTGQINCIHFLIAQIGTPCITILALQDQQTLSNNHLDNPQKHCLLKKIGVLYSFTLCQASVHAPNTRPMVFQKSWVCEINFGAVSREPALVIHHLCFNFQKSCHCENCF